MSIFLTCLAMYLFFLLYLVFNNIFFKSQLLEAISLDSECRGNFKIIYVRSLTDRLTGLRNHLHLQNHGLMLKAGMIHTFGMKFSIDLVYLRKDGLILKVISDLRPNKIIFKYPPRTCYVLELASNTSKQLQIKAGVKIQWSKYKYS